MAGKNKRIIKKKETTFERSATYRKRSKGLLKKAFELSVLCDIDVALIMYSPTGVLRHFSGNKKLERILQDYIQNLATNPETNEEERPVISQDTIDKINISAGQADTVHQQGVEAPERDQEIDEEIRQYQNKLVLLQEKAKYSKQKLYPNPGMSNSIQESMERKRYLEEVLYKIKERKAKLLSRFNMSCTDFPPPNTQGQQVQLEDPIAIGAPLVALPQSHEGASPRLQDPRFIAPQGNGAVQQFAAPYTLHSPIIMSNKVQSSMHDSPLHTGWQLYTNLQQEGVLECALPRSQDPVSIAPHENREVQQFAAPYTLHSPVIMSNNVQSSMHDSQLHTGWQLYTNLQQEGVLECALPRSQDPVSIAPHENGIVQQFAAPYTLHSPVIMSNNVQSSMHDSQLHTGSQLYTNLQQEGVLECALPRSQDPVSTAPHENGAVQQFAAPSAVLDPFRETTGSFIMANDMSCGTWIDSEFLCSNQPQDQPMQLDTDSVLWDFDRYLQTDWESLRAEFKF